MELHPYGLLLLAIVFGVCGQLALKRGMMRHPGIRLVDVASLARDQYVVGGFGAYAVSTLFYFQAVARLELSVAYPSVSLGYVLTIVLSKVLFREVVSPVRWGAAAIICAGVAVIGIGAG
jgi:multidrug transporter EmrE-like cation transporter